MNEIEKEMMISMVSLLNLASDRYYNTGTPIMSDAEFDRRLEDLRQLEKETGVIFSNSPSQCVGAPILRDLKETTHKYPMLSLDKCHSVQEVIDFANNKELVVSVKLDGMSVSLTYENGILVKGESRGNGYIGNDITEHVKRFLNVPYKINKNGIYTLYGEAIIKDDDFNEINKNNEFRNSRNTISGVLNSLDTSLVSKRRARFYCWDIIEGGSYDTLFDNLHEANELNFDVVPFWGVNTFKPKNIQNCIDSVFYYAEEEGLPCDGVVFKFNDIEYGKSLGSTSHHFKNGIAYKAEDDTKKTELINVEWSCGKSGQLTPIAIFKPVEIEGTTVERASLSNLSVMEETLGTPFVGEEIFVSKRNMIIPKVESAYKMLFPPTKNLINIPFVCPICGGKTEVKQDKDSRVLVCTNEDCKGKLLGKLTHFVSKNAMNIDGMSEATLEKFIELGFLTKFADIYTLKSEFYEDILKLDGFGKKSVDKLINAIENSRHTTLDRLLNALSIPLIGRNTSKDIAKYCNGDFDEFVRIMSSGKAFKFVYDIDGFGNAMLDSLREWWNKHCLELYELTKELRFENNNYTVSKNTLQGKKFVITGSLNVFANRDEAKERIENAGGSVTNSVSNSVDYLVCNNVSNSSKYKKALEFEIPIISEDELVEMLK